MMVSARNKAPAIRGLLQEGETALLERAIPSAALEARVLLAGILRITPTELILRAEENVPESSVLRFRELIGRRRNNEPVAYLLGTQNFFGREFTVTPDVLIPRPETELLVASAIKECRDRNLREVNILDLGTGSGCLAVSLVLEFPGARVVATDISERALSVARENGNRFKVLNRIDFRESDLYAALPEFRGYFDMIVSNPPYIATSEFSKLDPDLFFEPRLALDGGPRGLSVLDPLIQHGPAYLRPGGLMKIEIGYDQKSAVEGLFRRAGFETKTEKDDSGHHRVITGTHHGRV